MHGEETMWIVRLQDYRFPMIGTEPMSHDEALAVVRSIWPGAIDVE